MERLVRQFRRLERQEMLERETGLRRHRKLDWYVDEDCCWVFRGRFTAEQEAVIGEALKRAGDAIWEQQKSVSAETSFDEDHRCSRCQLGRWGETKLGNLLLLCRFHHGLVHEGGFGLIALPDNEFRFTRPDGEVIPQAPETCCRWNVFALVSQLAKTRLNITPETPIPDWDGEGMDDDLAVMGLLQCREDWFENLGLGPI